MTRPRAAHLPNGIWSASNIMLNNTTTKIKLLERAVETNMAVITEYMKSAKARIAELELENESLQKDIRKLENFLANQDE